MQPTAKAIGTLFPAFNTATTVRKPFDVLTMIEGANSFTGTDAQGDHYDALKVYWRFVPAQEAAVWDGEGRPPVGTVCGLTYKGLDQGEVTVLFLSDEVGVFANSRYGVEQHGASALYGFYQIRTPEQIAAEEREAEIIEIERVAMAGNSHKTMAEALYDAGYRKQVAP